MRSFSLSLSLSLIVLTASSAKAQSWEHMFGTGLQSNDITTVLYQQVYTSGSPNVTGASGYWYQYYGITGSTQSPPWPTWLDPLTTGTTGGSVPWSVPTPPVGTAIGVGKTFYYKVKVTRETGYDQWRLPQTPTAIIARRDRKWDMNVVLFWEKI